MPTQKYRLVLTVVLFAICIIAAIAVGITLLPTAESETAAPASDLAYYIKATGNTISVYRTDDDEMLYTLETPLNVLPELDQEALNEGMYIPDETALRRIIEDFEG